MAMQPPFRVAWAAVLLMAVAANGQMEQMPAADRVPADAVLGRFFAAVRASQLNTTQLSALNTIEAETAQAIRSAASLSPPDRIDTLRDLAVNTRIRVIDLLEPEQRKALQRKIRDAQGPQAPPRPVAPVVTPTGLEVGSPVPPLVLTGLDSTDVRTAQLRGRVVLLVWGSMSSAVFRARTGELAALAKSADKGLQIYVVYGPEAHPTGQWDIDRNEVASVSVTPPADLPARQALARELRQRFDPGVPVVLDDMANTASAVFSAGANTAVLIDRDGNLAWRQQWFDPDGLDRHIRRALASPASRQAKSP